MSNCRLRGPIPAAGPSGKSQQERGIFMYQNILEEALELKGQLTEWRRALHQMPEVGLELPKTSAFVKKALALSLIHI